MRLLSLVLALTAFAGRGVAQIVVLDAFDAAATTGSVRPGSSWVNNVTASASTITVGGTARDDNGWGATGQSINAAGMNFLAITAQRDTGHAGSSVVVQFEDRNLNTQVFSVSASAFAVGSLTQVQIPLGSWNSGFDRTQIVSWSLGGGGVAANAFRMTFDQLALTATAGAGGVVPSIAGDFSARSRVPGENTTFTVTATGSTPISYQWFKNGTAVTNNASATTASLTLTNLTALDTGNYTCVVTNSAGSATSGGFALAVLAAPATIALSGLAQTFDGTAHAVRATTAPAGLPVAFTYNSSATPPTNAGSYAVVATINHPSFTGRAEGTLVIARGPQSITYAALPATMAVGIAITLSATASSGGDVSFAVTRGNAQLSGASLTPRDAAVITIRATQGGTSNYLPATADFSFSAAKQNQSIAFAPLAGPVTNDAPITLRATATSNLPVTFNVIGGPAMLVGEKLTPTGSGVLIIRASQPGNDTINAAPDIDRLLLVTLPELVVPVPPPPTLAETRLANFSTRARAGAGDQVAIAGFVISGDGPKQVLVRAVGPTLREFGVADLLAVPALELFDGTRSLARNAGWSTNANAAAIATAAAQAGAFALSAGSADSALLTTLPPGNYTAVISAGDLRAGVGLIEVYDLSVPGRGQKISNLSIRASAGVGADVLIVGVVVQGETPKRLLIRAAGPALQEFGVSGVLAQPQLAVFSGSTEVARNAGWSGTAAGPAIAQAAASAGAFPFAQGSPDSALIVTLAPGNYTAQVSGVGATTGVALVEVYELP